MSEKRKVWGDFIAIHILYQKGSQFGIPSWFCPRRTMLEKVFIVLAKVTGMGENK